MMGETIEARVVETVFSEFGKGNIELGEKLLRKISFELKDEDDIKSKSLVYRNLAWANYMLKNKDMAEIYIMKAKKMIDECENYKEIDEVGYSKINDFYCSIFEESTSRECRLNINKINYNNNCSDRDRLDIALNAEANICMLSGDYSNMQDIFDDIYIYENTTIFEDEEKDKSMKSKIKHVREAILADLKIENQEEYEKIIKGMGTLNQSDIVAGM